MSAAHLLIPGRPRLRVALGAVVVLALVGFAIAVIVSLTGPRGSTTVVDSPHPISTASPSSSAAAALYVHVVGAVARPGLFELHEGDRVVDAVSAAGGFTGTADQAQVNLARLLVDGEQLVVPEIGAAPATASTAAPAVGGKVNLNTASETELETLPRVGPAMAQRIIDWRTKNGRFSTVADLMSVTGFGPKTLDGLKDLVTV